MAVHTCPNGHTYNKISCPTCPICLSEEMNARYGQEFPKNGNPAMGALHYAGITHFSDLTQYSEKDLLKLHGFGPKALGILKEALKEKGMTLLESENK